MLKFSEEEGRLVAVQVRHRDLIVEVYGLLRLDRATDELITELRGMRRRCVLVPRPRHHHAA
ncbi:MAG: hypothetical protein ACRDZ4_14275 [Egibacteraceae bacterium]